MYSAACAAVFCRLLCAFVFIPATGSLAAQDASIAAISVLYATTNVVLRNITLTNNAFVGRGHMLRAAVGNTHGNLTRSQVCVGDVTISSPASAASAGGMSLDVGNFTRTAALQHVNVTVNNVSVAGMGTWLFLLAFCLFSQVAATCASAGAPFFVNVGGMLTVVGTHVVCRSLTARATLILINFIAPNMLLSSLTVADFVVRDVVLTYSNPFAANVYGALSNTSVSIVGGSIVDCDGESMQRPHPSDIDVVVGDDDDDDDDIDDDVQLAVQ